MRISDWSSDVCSSDLRGAGGDYAGRSQPPARRRGQLTLLGCQAKSLKNKDLTANPMLGNSDVDPRPERRGRCRWRLFPMPCACGGLPAAAERMSSAAPANGRETCRKRHVKRCRVRLRYMPCAVSRWAGTNPQIHARSRGRVAVLAQTGLEYYAR